MNFIYLNTEILNNNINGQAFKLYCLLESYCYGDRNDCFPSQNTLSARMDKSIRTIQRYLKTLKDLGLIIIKRRGSTSNLYILPKKLNKKVQETAQKIQEKCSIFKAASKNSKTNRTNSSNEFNKTTKNTNPNNINQSSYINSQNNYTNSQNNFTNTQNTTEKSYSHNYSKKRKTNNFNDYSQRRYNFYKLEQALLGNASYKYDEVLE